MRYLPKNLPETNPFFELSDVIGEITKEKYSGRFECRIPNIRIQANIAKYIAFLDGGMTEALDQRTVDIHKMHAYCKHCIIECPDWFKESDYGYDLYDGNVLEAIYNKVLEKEEKWLQGIWGKKETKKEPDNE